MRLGIVAALALFATLASLPLAAAQVPDPAPVVETACAAVGAVDPQARDVIPVCPREEPAGPAAAEETAAPPAPEPATPQDVASLANEVIEDAKAIPADPASAGSRVLSIVATVIQFVKDLLDLPVQGAQAIGASFTLAGAAIADAADGARDAAVGLVDAIKELFEAPAREPAPMAAPKVKVERVAPVADDLVGRVHSLVA